MAKKNKLKTEDIALTEAQVQILIGEITAEQLAHDARMAQMNQEIDAVRELHEPALAEISASIQAKTLQVEAWVRSNRDSFIEPRSRQFPRGEIGLRWGQWCVSTVKGVTQKEAVKRLMKFRWGKPYIRQADPVLDKDALLKDREKIKPERLLAAGLIIDRDESFFFAPKTDEAPAPIQNPKP